jgi:hypothetical protein
VGIDGIHIQWPVPVATVRGECQTLHCAALTDECVTNAGRGRHHKVYPSDDQPIDKDVDPLTDYVVEEIVVTGHSCRRTARPADCREGQKSTGDVSMGLNHVGTRAPGGSPEANGQARGES